MALNTNTSRQPDVLQHRIGITADQSLLHPQDVVLAVEVVSPGTRRVDGFAKPGEYAAAESAELVELTEPFDIKLPVAEIAP
ncbi:hypothetical protein ACIBJE_16490 [Micromonospora sp. NPDC050187]|uniref:hypothetical protein n=1 Tax=Micromonospora sp. NPDC050187 TaxID=3364277 RepID=UPI00379F9E85